MQEKEKLEQPKLVEVDEVSEDGPVAISQPEPVSETVQEPPISVQPLSVYGDLEDITASKRKVGQENVPAGASEILLSDRLIAYIIDTCIVSTISTLFFMALMSIVVFNGGDYASIFLSKLQSSMSESPMQVLFYVWSFTAYNCVVPLFAWIFLAYTTRDFSSASLIAFIFMLLGPVVRLLYQCAFISGKRQATVGMMFSGIKVERVDGSRFGVLRALFRELLIFIEFATFYIFVFFPFITSAPRDPRPLHEKLTGTVLVRRKYGLTMHEFSELLPIGLAAISVAAFILGSNLFEANFGKAADLRKLEIIRKANGEDSENYLRHLWRYNLKRADAGDYASAFADKTDLQKSISTIELLSKRWGHKDERVTALTKILIKKTPPNRFPKERELLLNLAIVQRPEDGDSKDYAPTGELCQLYLARAKALPYEQSLELYQKIYNLGKTKLDRSVNTYKLRSAFMCAADALGYEEEMQAQMNEYEKENYTIEDLNRLNWNYWDYRLSQLMLADHVQLISGDKAAEIISNLSDWEQQPGHEAHLKTPRAKPDPIEERTIERLSQSYPTLMVQLKPSYWKYGGSP